MGALTLKVFSDELREWEFIEGEGIDPTDSFGVSLRLSIRENQIFLAEPNDPSTPWLTDKGRLFFDGMFDKSSDDKQTNWEGFFSDISELMYFIDHLNLHKRNAFSFIFAFENLSLETLNMLYLLKQNCSLVELRKVESHKGFNDFESQYQLSSTLDKPKLHMSSLGILINTNPRYEGYVLNLNLRQRFLKGNFKLLNVGSMLDLTFPVYNLGSNFSILKSLAEGSHLSCQDIKNAEFPVVITNTEIFKRNDAKVFAEVLKYVNVLDTAWNNVNVLNHNISSVGIQSLNRFLPLSTEDFVNFFGLYCINASLGSTANMKKLVELHLLDIFNMPSTLPNKVLVDHNVNSINDSVYSKGQNKLFNNYFHLPTSLFLEDNETYINTQGFIKRTTKLINFKKNSKASWQITRKFYANTKSVLFFNNTKDNKLINFDSVNSFNFKNYVNFQFYAVQTLVSLSFYLTKKNLPLSSASTNNLKSVKVKVLNTKVKGWLDDFFNGNGKDSFSYNSYVLVNCSKITRSSTTNFF
uniref:NADH dehydrogenase subunit 11b n=1 Tax=Nitzschia sp. (in: diatoms) TaxID=1884248 RepID=A0A2U9GIX8_9STRA|nr:NADH dehydrogenase subunit 11b [Nitzschia sp. (in: diatoms)]AWQ64317.1 NADH dehydrogenase subunit 11b [Nitzschia sp. (in: diatoms)]